jgi:hypothetical protein
VLKGSEKEPDGGEKNGGGKGLGALLASRAYPVSKTKGREVCLSVSSCGVVIPPYTLFCRDVETHLVFLGIEALGLRTRMAEARVLQILAKGMRLLTK